MAGDGPDAREVLLAQGIFAPLLLLLKSDSPLVVRSAAFALSNLVRGQDAPLPYVLKKSMIERGEKLLKRSRGRKKNCK